MVCGHERHRLPRLLLAEFEVFHGHNTKTCLVNHGQNVANIARANGVGLDHGEGEGRHIVFLDVVWAAIPDVVWAAVPDVVCAVFSLNLFFG